MKKKFSLRKFQRDDLARGALHPGFILGWATGLGKTIAMFLWPLLKVGFLRPSSGNRLCPAQPVLLVVPGDGHDQTDDESREHFRTVATRLDSQVTFLRLARVNPETGARELPPGYYLTSYTQLATNGVTSPPEDTPREFLLGLGQTRTIAGQKIKCVYDGTLMDLAQDCFGAIVVDEATKLQGEETLVSVGVRQIRAPFRLPMTATPIKNRLPQIFRLAHFACGGHDEPTPRFPYGNLDRDDFTKEFQVNELNLTRGGGRQRRTAQVCNVQRAWKIFAPVLIRRTKEQCGEEIVPMIRHVVRAPMGLHQAQVYQYHLNALYLDAKKRNAAGPRLQALRIASANPGSKLLLPREFPEGRIFNAAAYRSEFTYIPKVVTTLKLVEGVLQRGEQALIGGAFEDALDALSERLVEAGIPHLVLDGRTNPAKRGRLARRFKQGCPRSRREGLTASQSDFPITLAGVESMAELHSFRFVNNVILTSYSWALDKMEQIINRAYRLNSPWPVNLWSVLCDGSADRVLEASIHEKKAAAELVLGAQLLGADDTEVNLAELLELAVADFGSNVNYLDERDLEQDWPKLRASLAAAYQSWRQPSHPQPATLNLSTTLTRLPPAPPTPLIGEPGQRKDFSDLPLWQNLFKPSPID